MIVNLSVILMSYQNFSQALDSIDVFFLGLLVKYFSFV